MRIFDKNNAIKISADDIKDAKLSSLDFADEQTKKRAFVNVLGARLAMKFLFSQKIEVNNLYSLYSIHKVLEKLDIADIYYENTKIDVRLVFSEDEIFIPKSHFELGIFPDAYLVLLLKEDLSSADCLGFFEPKYLDEKNVNDNFYFFDKDELKDPAGFGDFLKTYAPGPKKVSTEEEIAKAENLLLSFVDDEISQGDRVFMLDQLAQSILLREKFVELENFELMSTQVVKDEELLKDNVLDIVGAQKVFNDENFDESSIEEINFEELEPLEELPELEEVDEARDASDKSSGGFGTTLAQGTVVAGAAALAGGAMAAGAASVTQSMAAASAQGVAEGLVSAGAAVVEGLGNISANDAEISSFDEIKADEAKLAKSNSLADAEEDFPAVTLDELEPLDELPELEDFEAINEPVAENSVEENASSVQESSDVVDLDSFDFDMFDDDSDDSQVEEAPSASEVASEITSESTDMEPLPEMSSEELDMSFEPVEELTADADADKKDEIFSFDDLESIRASKSEAFEEELSDSNISDFEFVEDAQIVEYSDSNDFENELSYVNTAGDEGIVNEYEQDSASAENIEGEFDIDDLSSQVDDLLKDVDLSDDDIAQAEADIPDISMSQLSKPESIYDNYESAELSDDALAQNLLAEGDNLDEEDSDLLKVLFKQEDGVQEEITANVDEMESLPVGNKPIKTSNPKRKIIAASVAGVILFSIIATGGLQSKKSKEIEFPKNMQTTTAQAPNQEQSMDGDMGLQQNTAMPADPSGDMGLDGNAVPPIENSTAAQAQPNRDMGQAVSEAFMAEPVSASISKVAWEVPEEYAYNDAFRKYLQTAGKNLKLTLQNDLLLATEMAYSDKMVIDLKLNKDGSIQSETPVISSGSKQIDKIVLQSVKETLMYLKIPAGEVKGQSISATLIINF